MKKIMYIVDRTNWKVKEYYEAPESVKPNAQFGALGDCFNFGSAQDLLDIGISGPDMMKVLENHTKGLPKSLASGGRRRVAQKLWQILQELDIPERNTAANSGKKGTRKIDSSTIHILREFKGHKTSTRSKCYKIIYDHIHALPGSEKQEMTIEAYSLKAIAELRLTRLQALGCLQKLTAHPTLPSVKIVEAGG